MEIRCAANLPEGRGHSSASISVPEMSPNKVDVSRIGRNIGVPCVDVEKLLFASQVNLSRWTRRGFLKASVYRCVCV